MKSLYKQSIFTSTNLALRPLVIAPASKSKQRESWREGTLVSARISHGSWNNRIGPWINFDRLGTRLGRIFGPKNCVELGPKQWRFPDPDLHATGHNSLGPAWDDRNFHFRVPTWHETGSVWGIWVWILALYYCFVHMLSPKIMSVVSLWTPLRRPLNSTLWLFNTNSDLKLSSYSNAQNTFTYSYSYSYLDEASFS